MCLYQKNPTDNFPRERLQKLGAGSLKDSDLLAILLRSGTKEKNVFMLSNDILRVVDESWPNIDYDKLTAIHGIGATKAATVVAALEFARRRIQPRGVQIRESKDVMPLLQHLSDRKQEHFICISLNGAHEVIATRIITIGLVSSTQVHPREVFCDALTDRASAVIVAHNHPSGDLTPSAEDGRVTDILKQAGKILGIQVLDHIIFSTRGYHSLAEHGSM